MINVQIRGQLFDICLYGISKNTFTSILDNHNNTSEYFNCAHLGNQKIEYDNIFSVSLPILSKDTEIQITSYNNDDYYNEGYTFYRNGLDVIKKEKSDFLLTPFNKSYDYIIFVIHHAYGTALETELFDLDYSSFSINNFTSFLADVPWSRKHILYNFKMNHLPIIDMNRKKYGIIKTESSVYEVNPQLKRNSSLFFDEHKKVYADSFISNDQIALFSKS